MNFIFAEELQKPYADLTVSTIEVPENSVAIKAQVIEGLHFVWLIGDADQTTVNYKFTTSKVGTQLGLTIPDDQRYIDTVVDGANIYHVIQVDPLSGRTPRSEAYVRSQNRRPGANPDRDWRSS